VPQVAFQLSDIGHLRFFLAPRLEDEEEEEAV
jgi:hypothetical protein